MEFNVSTFALEIVNFLILIWILQRLFYKPLLAIIAQRKQFIDDSLHAAQTLQQEAEAQRDLYENRLKRWEQEKRQAFSALQQQLEVERSKQLAQLGSELEQERQKAQAGLAFQQRQIQQQMELQALQNGARFAGLLLQQAATPELEARLCRLLMDEWLSLPAGCHDYLHTLSDKTELQINISSAFPLNWELQNALREKLNALIAPAFTLHFTEEPALMAGLRIDLGAWVLNANLQHELIGFAELAHVSEK